MALIAAHLNAGIILVVTLWRQVYNLPLPPPPYPLPLFSPSLISLMVSVCVCVCVCVFTYLEHVQMLVSLFYINWWNILSQCRRPVN